MLELTQLRLKELLNYDPETGDFTWAIARQKIRIGGIAGHPSTKDGYRRIKLDGKLYHAHRLVFLYMTGDWPKDQLDHRNGVPGDNRWGNLREATRNENHQNRALPSHNTSGLMGVSRHQNKWRAYITINGRRKHLGYFTTPKAAHAAYVAAKSELHTFNPVVRTT